MMEILQILGLNALAVTAMMLVLWLISVRIGDVSFIDAFWAFGFVMIAGVTFLVTDMSVHGLVLTVLTAIWGLRLGIFLFWRWRGHGVDRRYAAMLKNKTEAERRIWTLKFVFGLQGLLMWIVSLPIQLGQVGGDMPTLGVLGLLGLILTLIGIAFETIGDWQLTQFKAKPENAGKVLDTGLWRYTRHPNYFGDTCVWWGLFLIAAETPWGLFALPGPILMTVLLLQWSGVTLLERGMKKTRPDYDAYKARTSAFIPWPPKKPAKTEQA